MAKAKFKEDFIRAGIWSEYLSYRELLKSSGVPVAQARREAYDKFYPEYEKFLASGVPSRVSQVSPEEPTGIGPQSSSEPPGVEAAEVPMPPDVSVIMDRTCSVRESIEWVAKNLENDSVTPADAPSPVAWGMYRSYSSASRKHEFWDKVYVKLIPSKAQLNLDDEDDGDGHSMVFLCDRIRLIAERARKGGGEGEDKREREREREDVGGEDSGDVRSVVGLSD